MPEIGHIKDDLPNYLDKDGNEEPNLAVEFLGMDRPLDSGVGARDQTGGRSGYGPDEW